MHARIANIDYFLPEKTLHTSDLAALFPVWSVANIDAKTGIETRHIASNDECASDLAVLAALKLFKSGACSPGEIDFVLFCTQSPDYILPTTACLLQDRLEIPTTAGCLDFNLGCSGFVYGLGLSEGLITSEQANTILLITADTYSKYTNPADKGSRTIFGDGAAATLIRAQHSSTASFGPFIYGTNGNGADNLIVPNSGTRKSRTSHDKPYLRGMNDRDRDYLFMNGSKIFEFAVDVVPSSVLNLLSKANISLDQISLFVFHQANAYLLEEIRRRLAIPREKFQITIRHCANTVSSTIPIALKHAELEGKLRRGDTIMLVGFGVGYSWAATIVQWR
jgi:3-oxoacyl-[acyl-carrier-protein] synthase-3